MKPANSSHSLYAVVAGDKALREQLESIGGAELLAEFETRATEIRELLPPVPIGDAGLKAAISHTFVVPDLQASPSEVSAVLAASAGLTVNGESRLRLEDTARAAILDIAFSNGALSLQLAPSEQVDSALLYNDEAEADIMVSAWLRTFLRNQTINLSQQSEKRLAAAFSARSALRLVTGLGGNVPALAELKRLSDLAELIEPLRIMVGLGDPRQILKKDRFAGRSAELTKLRAFVDTLSSESILETVSRQVFRSGRSLANAAGQGQARLMMISAPGGLGKSTLVAKFALDHAVSRKSFPFAYLDFDRATLQPRNPAQLLIETVRQIALYFPEEASELMRLREEIRAGLEGGTPASFDVVCAKFRHTVQAILSLYGARTFLLVLDTFEIAQSDPKALEGVARFLDLLARGPFSELAIVISGRAEVKEFGSNNALFDGGKPPWSLAKLKLAPLKLPDAIQMVDLLGEAIIGNGWHHAWARKIVGRNSDPASRREPLSLRVAVEIVRNARPTEREAIVEEIGKLGENADDAFVGRLYEKRILEHIADENARKLAWPGLVVRRITRDVARTVLAPLCDLTSEQADAAFDRLGREVWIVDRDDDVLRHRVDLRARTLPLMRQRDPARFAALASAMVDYHLSLGSDAQNTAEALYYRLLRGDDPKFLMRIWSPDVAAALSTARDDFEVGSSVWLHLSARLSSRLLPPETFVLLPDPLVWEHVAQCGSGLRQLDDANIDKRVLDLAGRAAPESGALAPDTAAVRQSVLIKAGAWSAIDAGELMFPTSNIDIVPTAFFATVASATGQASTESWVARHPDIFERLGDATRQTTWQALAYSLLPSFLHDHGLYQIVDQRLADTLSANFVWRGGSRAALRMALSFGSRSMQRAFALLADITASELRERSPGSISTAELRALVSEADLPGSQLLIDAAGSWLDDETPRRITAPEILVAAREVIVRLAGQHLTPNHIRAIRRFATARSEDWVTPIGYAIARNGNLRNWSETIGRRISSYGQAQDGSWMKWITGGAASDRIPRDPIRLALLADEAGDLYGFVKETSLWMQNGEASWDLDCISNLLHQWITRSRELLDGNLPEVSA